MSVNQNRRTGRTFRMLLSAILAASEGQTVIVSAFSLEYSEHLKRKSINMIDSYNCDTGMLVDGNIRIGNGSIIFTSHDSLDHLVQNASYLSKAIKICRDHFDGTTGYYR